jgi:hypothetical protein
MFDHPSINVWETLSASWAILQFLGTFWRVVPTDNVKHAFYALVQWHSYCDQGLHIWRCNCCCWDQRISWGVVLDVECNLSHSPQGGRGSIWAKWYCVERQCFARDCVTGANPTIKQATNPRQTAQWHKSWTVWSAIWHSPSDKNIITGLLKAMLKI